MNPYARFRLVSNTVSAAIIVAGLAVFGGPVFSSISTLSGGAGTPFYTAMGASVGVLVVFWLAMTEAIFPALFRFNFVRRMILGKYYVEGTWLQAERGTPTGNRLSVIDIQPAGKSFIFSGYALNQDLEIESNTLIEFSKFEWPFMTFKYRNSLSDGGDGQRDGVGEIQFEMNRSAAVRFNGYAQFVKNGRRLKVDGAKLTKNREVKQLRSLEGRGEVLGKYWNLFFATSLRVEERASLARPETEAAPVRSQETERRRVETAVPQQPVVQRRRASDWRQDDETPAADRARDTLKNVAPNVVIESKPEPKPEPAPEPAPKVDLSYEDAADDQIDDAVDETDTDVTSKPDSDEAARRRRFRRSA
jgi:hypothetical protein